MSLAEWKARGRELELEGFGRRLFVVERGPTLARAGTDEAPTLLLVHGFPTSSYDFHRVLDRLAQTHRVIAHDQLGFGLSDKPRLGGGEGEYGYSLFEQAEVALALWRQLGVRRARLLAHDYGTSVVTEILARRAFSPVAGAPELDAVILCNGSVNLELASLTWPQKLLAGPLPVARAFARVGPRALFEARIRKTLAPSSRARFDPADIEAMWEGNLRAGGRERLADLSRYLHERRRFWARWREGLRRTQVPALVLWGRADPIALPAIAECLAAELPQARLRWLEGLGHFPMLEDPGRWAEALLEFLDGLD